MWAHRIFCRLIENPSAFPSNCDGAAEVRDLQTSTQTELLYAKAVLLHIQPRRLSLDFDDLVLEGLDFASIDGEIVMESGVADIRLVQLNGPVGVVDITGTSNLVTQQLNQNVTVLPRVSAALPIIGIISGGATAGVGALVAGGLLKGLGVDFDRLGLREFSITGSFSSPIIEQK